MESTKLPRLILLRASRLAAPQTWRALACGVAASAALLPGLAQAQIFVCKDANGRTLTSDRPIPECANRAMRELSREGLVKREIAAPLTAEQRRQKQAADDKRKADEAAAAEQRQKDGLLLSTYRSEQQIDAERQRSISQLRNNINIVMESVDVAERKKRAAQAEADVLKEKGKPIPPAVRAKITEADQASNYEKKTADSLESDMVKLKTKYDDLLKAYREAVIRSTAKPASPDVASDAAVAASKAR